MLNLNISLISIIYLLVRLIAAGMLFWALGMHPYSYYSLLKWIVFIVAGFTAYKFFNHQKNMIGIPGAVLFAGIAVLFNPIFVIHLNQKIIWSYIDVIVAVLFLISIALSRK